MHWINSDVIVPRPEPEALGTVPYVGYATKTICKGKPLLVR